MATGASIQAPEGQTAPAAPEGTQLPVAAAVLAFAACYAGGVLGRAGAVPGAPVPLVWPPGAVVLAALLLNAPRTWPAFLLAALAAAAVLDVQHGRPGWAALAFAVTGIVEALFAAVVVRGVLGGPPRLDRRRDVTVFLLAGAGLAPLAAVSAGVGALVMAGLAPSFVGVWRAWLPGDALTHATLTAAVVAWLAGGPPLAAASTAARRLETGLLTAGLAVLGLLVLDGAGGTRVPALLFLSLALLLWAAVRFGARGATGALAAVTGIAVLGAATGRGPFATLVPVDAVLHLQLPLLAIAVPILLLAAAVAERRAGEAALRKPDGPRRPTPGGPPQTLDRGAVAAARRAQRLLQSTLDALSAHIAILDERGIAIAVNEPWRRFAERGGLPGHGWTAGADCAALCDGVQGPTASAAGRVAAAIREMLGADRTEFRLEYRCDEVGLRWFQVRMRRFSDDGVRIVLAHEEVTDLKEAEAGLRDLTGRLLRLQDEERRRIARELHDGAGQNLVALSMNLARLARLARADERTAAIVADSLELVEQSLQEMRTLSYVLHPPTLDGVGLTSAIRWYVEGFAKRSGIEVRLELTPDAERLPQDVERALFRVIQESLINVHRHSGSGTATIRLRRDAGTVRLDVTDEGTGFADAPGEPGDGQGSFGGGIPGMRERLRQLGGYLDIRSDTRGTTVTAVAPLPVESDAAHPAR